MDGKSGALVFPQIDYDANHFIYLRNHSKIDLEGTSGYPQRLKNIWELRIPNKVKNFLLGQSQVS